MNYWALIGILITIFGLGGGSFYILYLRSRPKKESWIAYVYQLSNGIQPKLKDKHGNIISELQLRDLKAYGKDIVTKNLFRNGKTVYKLERLNLSVGTINSSDVDYFGREKVVHILVDKGEATVLRGGFDETTGSKIYIPIPREDVEIMTSKIALHKERLNKKPDILGKVLSYFVVGMALLSLVAISYININGSIKITQEMSENIKQITKVHQDTITQSREFLKETQEYNDKMIKVQENIASENKKQLALIRDIYSQKVYNLSNVN